MGKRIDDRLPNHGRRNLECDRRLSALVASTDAAIDNREDEIFRLIHLLEQVSFEHAVKGHRPLDIGAMEMHAADFGAGMKRCGSPPKSSVAAWVGRPSRMRFRWASTSAVAVPSGKGNCRSKRARRTKWTTTAASMSSSVASMQGRSSKGRF